jgi:Icc protein
VQFTDTHLFAAAGDRLRGIATLATLKSALQQAEEHIRQAAVVLVTGDLVQDDAGGYRRFVEAFKALDKPILTLPGNHDDLRAMRATVRGAPFQYCGQYDIGLWRIVMLNSVKVGAASGFLSAEALHELEHALSSASRQHVLICLHHQPVPMHSRWLDSVGLENPDAFFGVVDAHANVRAVLWGHVHQCFDAERRGVRLLATPSTCAQFMPLVDDFAIDPRPPAYRILELTAAGAVNTEVVWLNQDLAT